MIANIEQHVIARRRRAAIVWRPSVGSGSWQRGSVQPSTITLALGIVALAIVALLGFFYLQQVLGTASRGSDIHALESQLIDLGNRQHQLELEGAELRSLQRVEQNIQKLNLVATGEVAYLTPEPGRVAAAP